MIAFDRIAVLVIDGMVDAEGARHGKALRDGVDTDDGGGAHEPRTRRGAETDRPQSEHGHRVADAGPCRFRHLRSQST